MSSLTALSPADRHRAAAADFTTVVDAVTDWDAQTPVKEWKARDVVGHLVEWLPGFLSGAGVPFPAGSAADDPAAAWRVHNDAVQAMLDGPDADKAYDFPMLGEQPLSTAIDMFYTADVYMHSWDLARSNGIDVELDPEYAAGLHGGMAQMGEMLRASGQFGTEVPVAADADPATKLIGFIGRDPAWQPS